MSLLRTAWTPWPRPRRPWAQATVSPAVIGVLFRFVGRRDVRETGMNLNGRLSLPGRDLTVRNPEQPPVHHVPVPVIALRRGRNLGDKRQFGTGRPVWLRLPCALIPSVPGAGDAATRTMFPASGSRPQPSSTASCTCVGRRSRPIRIACPPKPALVAANPENITGWAKSLLANRCHKRFCKLESQRSEEP